MCSVKVTFREPAQHASLPNPRVSEHEQPEQEVVLFSHDPKLSDEEKPCLSDAALETGCLSSALVMHSRPLGNVHAKLKERHLVHFTKTGFLERFSNILWLVVCFTIAFKYFSSTSRSYMSFLVTPAISYGTGKQHTACIFEPCFL